MACILGFQDQGHIIDMVPQPNNGINLNAHKLLLAAVPNYCGLKFSGEWGCPTPYSCGAKARTKIIPNTVGDFKWLRFQELGNNEEIAKSLDIPLASLDGTNNVALRPS